MCYNTLHENEYIFLPIDVTVNTVWNPPSVRVSWQGVEDADRYNITFTKVKGNNQIGLCKHASHTVTLSVNTTNTSIVARTEVGTDGESKMLRAYTTYSITVEAESDVLNISYSSVPITFTTPQTSITYNSHRKHYTVLTYSFYILQVQLDLPEMLQPLH